MMRFVVGLGFLTLALSTSAQDKSYNTDQLKAAKRISADQWKQLSDASAARSKEFVTSTKGAMEYYGQQLGYTVIKQNQTLDLKAEVIAIFDNVASAGQTNAGAVTARSQKSFKIGPGKFEVKDGVIKRIP